MQKEFRSYNIIVCGTGATGSQLIPFLTQLLSFRENCTLTFIDGDRVELKNLRNQKFLATDEGLPKSRVLQRRYSKIYPDLEIRFVDEYVKSTADIVSLMAGDRSTLNILVGCVDNNPTRKILRDVFHNEAVINIAYLDSGNGTLSMQGQVVSGLKLYSDFKQVPDHNGSYNTFRTKSVSKVYAPCAGDIFEDIMSDTETVDHVTSCSYVADKNPQNIATNIMAATTLFSLINQIVSFNEISTGITYFDAKNFSMVHREIVIDDTNNE